MTDLTPERLDLIRSSCRRSVATSDKYPLITMDAADVLALLAAVDERDALAAKLDADGLPVVTTVGDLTARHQLARPRIRVAGREGKLNIVEPSDVHPGTVTLIWGDWWEAVALEEPCEVLP